MRQSSRRMSCAWQSHRTRVAPPVLAYVRGKKWRPTIARWDLAERNPLSAELSPVRSRRRPPEPYLPTTMGSDELRPDSDPEPRVWFVKVSPALSSSQSG